MIPRDLVAELAAILDESELLTAVRERFTALEALAARGALAGGVAAELATPLAHIHDELGAAVTTLDHHFATAKGPDPLPVAQAIELRERVAQAFLDAGNSARLAADLAAVASSAAPTREDLDVNDLVTRAVALARHRVARNCELLVDLGAPPAIHGDGAQLAQALAHVILEAEEAGGDVTIETRAAEGRALVTISHRGAPGLFAGLVDAAIGAAGGTVTRTASGVLVSLRAIRTAAP